VAANEIITPEMQAVVGIESEPWTLEVDKLQIRLFARAVGYTDPLFFDEVFAKSKGYRSLPCPPHYLGTPIFNPADADPTFGGARSRRARLNHGLKRVLNGGTEIEMLDTICAGDTLMATSRIAELAERTGRLGTMLIVTTEMTYRRDDQVVAIARGTSIHY
jgi:MaoC dehydratase-like protein